MTREELEFLKDLQRELKEQDTDCQAAPRFWGILEEGQQVVPDGFGDYIMVIDKTYGDSESYTLEEYVKHIMGLLLEDDDEVLYKTWDSVDKDDINEVIEFANKCLKRNVEVFEIKKTIHVSEQTGCFLTKRAAKKHIELNGYNYNNPKTYAMTAWRNPEFEKFLNIFENLDLTELEKLVK
jgi:hypothetical protein